MIDETILMIFVLEHLQEILFCLAVVFSLLYALGYGYRDDTDDKKSRKRSGLSLYTDYGTGCQYVKVGLFGKLQPRRDRYGVHVCVKKN